MAHQVHSRLRPYVENRCLFKAIAGIDRFDRDHIMDMAQAAVAGGASALDVAVVPEAIMAVKAKHPNLILFASSLDPMALAEAAKAGADVLEIGNYDALRKDGKTATAEQVVHWTRATRAAVGPDVAICATIPGEMSHEAQVELATQLQAAGADVLQTEWATPAALKAVKAITEAVEIPIIVAGGVTADLIPAIMRSGAHGVGVGQGIYKLDDPTARANEVYKLVTALAMAGSFSLVR